MTRSEVTSRFVSEARGTKMPDQSRTIAQFLDATAARQPTPGGGSVTALAGALAASLGEMVVNYSIGRKGLEPFTNELKPALAEFHRARQVLTQLMAEDQQAYAALTAARKLPEEIGRASCRERGER